MRVGGIDYLGLGGLVYLPGTRRPKYGGRGYEWGQGLNWNALQGKGTRDFTEALESYIYHWRRVQQELPARRPAAEDHGQ